MPLPRRCLYAPHWPLDLQQAWNELRSGSRLRRSAARRWADPTWDHVEIGIGQFAFHRATAACIPDLPFPDQVTPETLDEFIQSRLKEVRPTTVESLLVGLLRGMQVLWPRRDWSCIKDAITMLPDGRPDSRRRKQARVRHAAELLELGLRVCAEAEALRRGPLWRAVRFRTGTMIAFLAVRPIRSKNLVGMILGVHLIRREEGWLLELCARETKNRESYAHPIPNRVGALLDRYVNVHRPILEAKGATGSVPAFVWLSYEGRPLTGKAAWDSITEHTAKAFGRPVHPHLFRSSAVTTWAIETPTTVLDARHVIGDRDVRVLETAYNMASSIDAGDRWHAVLEDLCTDTPANQPPS
jgi:integrase/recombinase XerD